MWQYSTGSDAVFPIILYDYQPDKRQERPKEFLKGFSGYLTTDGSSSYNGLPDDIILTGCFYHARSHFVDALRCLSASEQPGSLAMVGKNYCDKIFDIEREIKDKTFDERYEIRNEKTKPVLDEFKAWLDSIVPCLSVKSKLGIAIKYCLNQWVYLIRFLLDGRLECSNNRAEGRFKTFVINRKNFLFAKSVEGGRAAAVLHSITETAKASHLNPYSYLTYVLKTAAGANVRNDPELLKKLMPENAPKDCREPREKNTS
jgi:hypothetical protein